MLADNFEGWLVATETTHQQWQTGIEQRLGLRWAVCVGEGAGKGEEMEGGGDGGRRRWREEEGEGRGDGGRRRVREEEEERREIVVSASLTLQSPSLSHWSQLTLFPHTQQLLPLECSPPGTPVGKGLKSTGSLHQYPAMTEAYTAKHRQTDKRD